MKKNPETQETSSASPDAVDAKLELTEDELEDVSGGLIALLLPAVQKVRDAANVQLCDGSVMPVAKK